MKKRGFAGHRQTRPSFWSMYLWSRQGQARLPFAKRGGQVIIEYTVLFGIIAVVTAIATAAFFSRVCRSDNGTSAFERYSNTIQQRIINSK